MRTMLHSPRRRTRSIAAATLGAFALLGSLLVATPAQALNDTGTGGVFVPATGRFMDTGRNIGGYDTAMPAKGWRTVKVTGKNGVPDDGTVGAVSVVATALSIPGQGLLYGRPDADAKSTVMGIYGGDDKQNTSFSSVLAVAADGTIQVQAETSIRLILDVQGYYTANTDGTAAGGFVPLNGTRIADTRSGQGFAKDTIAPGERVTLQVAGVGGIPKGASAAIINMIAVNRTAAAGYVTPYPTGGTQPLNSFNYSGNTATSMQAQVQLSKDGKVTFFNDKSTTDLVIDTQGYFTAAGKTGAVFTPGAGRAYDTRSTGNTVMGKNETRSIQIAGKAGVPVMGSGINAVVLTLTSLKSTAGAGNATVWADGTTRPNTTSINFDETTIRTNTITVPLGANGKVSINSVADPTNYVFDVQGWYSNAQTPKIVCDAPYVAGTWQSMRPEGGVACRATFAPAPQSSTTGTILLDGDIYDQFDLSLTEATARQIDIPLGGSHTISANAVGPDGVPVEASYAFGFGNWTTTPLLPVPASGTTLRPDFTLGVEPENDGFPNGTIFDYSLARDADLQNIVWESGSISGFVEVPPELVADHTTYYWNVKVTGPAAPGAAISERAVTSTITVDSSATTDAGEEADWADDGPEATATDPSEPNEDLYYSTTSGSGTASSSSVMRSSSPGTYVSPANWAPCGYKDKNKLVREYIRVRAQSGKHKMSGTVADLRCGDSNYGYFHILDGHATDWQNQTYGTTTNWRDLADWAIKWTLQDADSQVFVPKNPKKNYKTDRWCFNRIVYLKNKKTGQVVKKKNVFVIMGETGVRIITAYPRDGVCTSKSDT